MYSMYTLTELYLSLSQEPWYIKQYNTGEVREYMYIYFFSFCLQESQCCIIMQHVNRVTVIIYFSLTIIITLFLSAIYTE